MLALALTTVIDETSDYIETLQNLIWEICNEYSWCIPASLSLDLAKLGVNHRPPSQRVDLFAAETADALAETVTMLKTQLDPAVHERVRAEIEQRVFQPLSDNPVHFWWESAQSNWASVCAGSVGMAALLLIEDRERLAGIIDRLVRALECFLESYGDDGGCAEGVGYWLYGFGYYVYFAQMLYDYTGGALDLFNSEKIRRIAQFPAGVSLSNGNFVNYSDGVLHYVLPSGLISKLHERFKGTVPEMSGVPSFQGDHCYRWATMWRSLQWTDSALFGRPTPEGTAYYPDLAWVVDRHYAGKTILAFSAKGGHNAEPHNHNDLGHFILHVGGESLLADLGAGLYTRQYFGPERYTILNNSSLGHSVPVINQQPQQAGEKYKAKVIRYEHVDTELFFDLDLTAAYDTQATGLAGFRRSFHWKFVAGEQEARLDLQDDFQFTTRPESLIENFISLRKPELEAAKGIVTWEAERGQVQMLYSAEQFEPFIEELPVRDHEGILLQVYRLSLRTILIAEHQKAQFTFSLTTPA